MSDAAWQEYLDRTYANGLIPRPLQAGEVVDYSYLEQAARPR